MEKHGKCQETYLMLLSKLPATVCALKRTFSRVHPLMVPEGKTERQKPELASPKLATPRKGLASFAGWS